MHVYLIRYNQSRDLLVDVFALSSFPFRNTKSFKNDVLQLKLGFDDVGRDDGAEVQWVEGVLVVAERLDEV